jgi:hypothetical protein
MWSTRVTGFSSPFLRAERRTRMKSYYASAVLVVVLATPLVSRAQDAPVAPDSTTVQGAIYDRPYIATGRAAVGGYAEAHVGYFVEDGITEGPSAQIRRFNLFLFAPLGPRLRFTSELEFEHGTEEIALETAVLDIELHSAFIMRGGVILVPVGAFNQNHDSPRWDFVDRPLVSTSILPATLSEVGFGIYGRGYTRHLGMSYDLYVTNGLSDGVLVNNVGRTCVPCGKDAGLLGGDTNGSPALSARVAALRSDLGEAGLSVYTTLFNRFTLDGETVDIQRRVTLVAFDAKAQLGRVVVRGEAALALVDVPVDLEDLYGARQWGAHVDGVFLVASPRFFGYSAPLAAVIRLEVVDFHAGTFRTTGERVYDEILAFVAGLSFRPAPESVVLLNYRRSSTRDLVGNPAVRAGGLQFGFATYF